VVEEVRQVLADSGIDAGAGSVNVDDKILKKMVYLNAVIDETLRLYNPVLRMERRANRDFCLGEVTIAKGMLVGVPVWAMHHCEEYFPDPYEFQPTRFLPENRPQVTKMTYLPFGAGPRDCIGRRFSLLETRLALVDVLLKFRFFPTAQTQQPLRFVPNGRPLLGPTQVVVGVERRQPEGQS
jgi:cytochrome P450